MGAVAAQGPGDPGGGSAPNHPYGTLDTLCDDSSRNIDKKRENSKKPAFRSPPNGRRLLGLRRGVGHRLFASTPREGCSPAPRRWARQRRLASDAALGTFGAKDGSGRSARMDRPETCPAPWGGAPCAEPRPPDGGMERHRRPESGFPRMPGLSSGHPVGHGCAANVTRAKHTASRSSSTHRAQRTASGAASTHRATHRVGCEHRTRAAPHRGRRHQHASPATHRIDRRPVGLLEP